MNNCMNVAAGVFGVMVPVALLVCGWNVLAPEKWCWVERGISIWGGAIATAFLFLFAAALSSSAGAWCVSFRVAMMIPGWVLGAHRNNTPARPQATSKCPPVPRFR